jgi:hypothetical protein
VRRFVVLSSLAGTPTKLEYGDWGWVAIVRNGDSRGLARAVGTDDS